MQLRYTITHLATLIALGGACVLVLLPTPSQAATTGSGQVATERRATAAFQAITVEGSMDLEVRQGATLSVQVQADDNLLPLLQTDVAGSDDGATLRVRWPRGETIRTRSKVFVKVVTPTLSAVTLVGAGDARVQGIQTPALKLSLSGSGDARLDGVDTADLKIRLSGSGHVSASGSATTLAVSMAGSGDVELSALKADDVSLRIAGSGDAALHAEKTLDVSIAGSGDVVYSGAAAVKSRVAGSGGISRR